MESNVQSASFGGAQRSPVREILSACAGLFSSFATLFCCELHVSGLRQPFLLSGGAQDEALRRQAELMGKKIRLTGKLRTIQGAGPPGLTVEEFEVQP